MPEKFLVPIAAVILALTGCVSQIQKPVQIYREAESAPEALSVLKSRSQNAVSLKANGRCRLQYYDDNNKPKTEDFAVKLWVKPPGQIRLQGDVAFNPKGITLGSNEEQFWLAIKPKEISSYWWGKWDGRGRLDKLMINPNVLLEALGIVQLDSSQNWSLSNESSVDVLTKHNRQGAIEKKIYISNYDYLIKRIEYFDASQAVVVTELDEYKQVSEDFFVPAKIKIIKQTGLNVNDSVSITISLRSVRAANFSEKQCNRLFTRPQPRGFKHIYEIIDGNIIEQLRK